MQPTVASGMYYRPTETTQILPIWDPAMVLRSPLSQGSLWLVRTLGTYLMKEGCCQFDATGTSIGSRVQFDEFRERSSDARQNRFSREHGPEEPHQAIQSSAGSLH